MTSFNRTNRTRRAAIGLAIAASALTLPLALTACAAPDSSSSQQQQPGASAETTITATATWAKASDAGAAHGEGMTGVFGELANNTDDDLTIASLTSDAAGVVELHEVVDGKMRAIQGDVTIAAGDTFTLEPGANHIMLMQMTKHLVPGDEVTVTIEFSNGTDFNLVALVKDTSGANESYEDLEDEHAGH